MNGWIHLAKTTAGVVMIVAPFAVVVCREFRKPFDYSKFYKILGATGTIGLLEGIATLTDDMVWP